MKQAAISPQRKSISKVSVWNEAIHPMTSIMFQFFPVASLHITLYSGGNVHHSGKIARIPCRLNFPFADTVLMVTSMGGFKKQENILYPISMSLGGKKSYGCLNFWMLLDHTVHKSCTVSLLSDCEGAIFCWSLKTYWLLILNTCYMSEGKANHKFIYNS